MICLEEFKTDDKLVKCVNGHRIHLDCIIEHIAVNDGFESGPYKESKIKTPCPYCKQKLDHNYYIL